MARLSQEIFSIVREFLAASNERATTEELLSQLVRRTGDLFEASSCAILLLEGEARRVRVKSSQGLSFTFIKELQAAHNHPLVARVIDRCEAVRLSRGQEPLKFEHEYEHLVAIPLRARGETIGLAFMDAARPGPFTDEDADYFTSLMELAALTIEHDALKDEALKASNLDSLTDIFNYRFFHEALFRETLRADFSGHPLSLCLLAIEWLKEYNFIHGHVKGDRVIRDVARLVKEGLRPVDFAARYGGAKFVIVLPETDAKEAVILSDRVRACVEGHPFEEREPRVTMSIGIVTYPVDAENERDLISRAEELLYDCRRRGGNLVISYGTKKV